jgi:ABC-type dipeptide/oligopeptide/nickel transport system ATPase component
MTDQYTVTIATKLEGNPQVRRIILSKITALKYLTQMVLKLLNQSKKKLKSILQVTHDLNLKQAVKLANLPTNPS